MDPNLTILVALAGLVGQIAIIRLALGPTTSTDRRSRTARSACSLDSGR